MNCQSHTSTADGRWLAGNDRRLRGRGWCRRAGGEPDLHETIGCRPRPCDCFGPCKLSWSGRALRSGLSGGLRWHVCGTMQRYQRTCSGGLVGLNERPAVDALGRHQRHSFGRRLVKNQLTMLRVVVVHIDADARAGDKVRQLAVVLSIPDPSQPSIPRLVRIMVEFACAGKWVGPPAGRDRRSVTPWRAAKPREQPPPQPGHRQQLSCMLGGCF